MAYKKFSDFEVFNPPDLNDYLVGYRELGGEFRASIQDVTKLVKTYSAPVVGDSVYVSISGDDSAAGTSDTFAFRTIKRGMAKALEISRSISQANKDKESVEGWGTSPKPVTVFVRSGVYVEDNPIYVPPGVSIVGESIRSVTIVPKNKFYDILWVNNKNYITSLNFKDYFAPAYAVAFPEFYYVNNKTLSATYPNTRIAGATARAFDAYSTDPSKFTATKENKASFENLSLDSGNPIFDPFKIAFIDRYYQAILGNETFYTEAEVIEGKQFWQTAYYNLSSSVQTPYVILSPYIDTISTTTQSSTSTVVDAGGGLFVDGTKAAGPRVSMYIRNSEQFNEGGRGVHATNNGYIFMSDNVSTCNTESVLADNGGTVSVNGSTISYGLSGLVAVGKSPTPTLIGTLKTPISSNVTKITVTNLGSASLAARQAFPNSVQPYVGQVFSIVDTSYTVTGSTSISYLTATNSNSYFVVTSASKVRPAVFPYSGYECDVLIDNVYTFANDNSLSGFTFSPTPTVLNTGSDVVFYVRSSIMASSQIFEHVGSGTVYLSAVPRNGGIGKTDNEVLKDIVGNIYVTSEDESGIIRFGRNVAVDQSYASITSDSIYTNSLTALSAFFKVTNITEYELSGFNVTGDVQIDGYTGMGTTPNTNNRLTVSGNISANQNIIGDNARFTTGYIKTLSASSATIDSLDINSVEVNGFTSTGNVNVSGNVTATGTVFSNGLNSVSATIITLSATNSRSLNLSTSNLSAGSSNLTTAYVTNLSSLNSSSFNLSTSNLSAASSLFYNSEVQSLSANLYSGGNVPKWNSVYSSLTATSANWNTAFDYSSVFARTSANPTVSTITVNNTATIATLNVTGDATITGNLSTLGTITYLDTNVTVTSAMTITNTGTGPALKVTQTGEQPIIAAYDDSSIALWVDGTTSRAGYVGIGTSTPNEKLTVVGNISSNGIIYSLNSNSSIWSGTYTSVSTSSASWNSVYTRVNSSSAAWDGPYLPLSGGSLTGTLSANSIINQNLTASNIFGYSNETVFSDGTNLNGNGTGTATLNYTNGVFVGKSTTPNSLTVSGNVNSTGTVTASAFVVNGINNLNVTGAVQTSTVSVTATDTYLQILVNGITKYIRLYDVI